MIDVVEVIRFVRADTSVAVAHGISRYVRIRRGIPVYDATTVVILSDDLYNQLKNGEIRVVNNMCSDICKCDVDGSLVLPCSRRLNAYARDELLQNSYTLTDDSFYKSYKGYYYPKRQIYKMEPSGEAVIGALTR